MKYARVPSGCGDADHEVVHARVVGGSAEGDLAQHPSERDAEEDRGQRGDSCEVGGGVPLVGHLALFEHVRFGDGLFHGVRSVAWPLGRFLVIIGDVRCPWGAAPVQCFCRAVALSGVKAGRELWYCVVSRFAVKRTLGAWGATGVWYSLEALL